MPAEPSLLRDATPAEQALAAGVAGNTDLLPKTAPVSPRVNITIKKFEWGDKGARRTIKDVARMARDNRNDPFVRAWVVQKIWEGRAAGKDVDSPMTRAQVLLEAVQREFVYVSDPTGTEMIVAPKWLVQGFIPGGDCFAEGTLLLTEGNKLVPIERVEVGQKIWGLDKWVRVEAAVAKGPLHIDVICLNNGSQVRLTGNHHVNVLLCPRHPHPAPGSGARPCSCPVEDRTPTRMSVSDLMPGMVLPTPERLPFGSDTSLTTDRAYVEGLYLSDGWSEGNRFAISGKDGHPKEAQKREVKTICDSLGIHTYWSKRYIRVNDAGWTRRLHEMGTHAPEKHLLSLDLGEDQAAQSLRGIMADSGRNHCGSRTLTTTSRLLAVQARVLNKMFGISCGWQYIENHGGLGKNPIWRLTPRQRSKAGSVAAEKILRVRSVERRVAKVPCYDIQTEDHNVYLPEHDVTVLNCDDMVFLTATALLIALSSSGMRCAVLGHSYDQSEALSHILVAVYAPDSRDPNKGKWFYADPCTKLPLGPPVAPPTWELVYDPMEPDAPICDANSCLANPQVKPARITWPHADLVGVAGPPTLDSSPVTLEGQPMSLEVLEPSPSSPPPPVVPDSALPGVAAPPAPAWSSPEAPVVAMPPWQAPRASIALVQSAWQRPEAPVALVKATSALGQAFEPAPELPEPQRITEEAWPAWRDWLTSLRDAVQLDAYDLNDKYERLRSICNDAQIPFPPQVPGAVWDATQSALFSKAMQFVTDALTFLQDAIDGKRDVLKVAPPDQLALPSAQQAQDLGIASLPTDSIRYTLNSDVYAIPVPQAVPVAAAKFVSSLAGVGLLPFLLPAVSGAAVSITVGMIFNGRALIAALKESIEHITSILLMREMGNLADKGWTPDQVQAGLGKINQGIVDRKDAEVRRLEEEKKIIEAENNKIKTTLDRILWIGGLALLGVGGVWAWNNFGKPYMAARSSGSGSASSDREPETTSHRGPASRPSDIHDVPTEPIPRRPVAINDDPTKVSPVYQGNPYQGNPAQDAFTLMDQLNRHIAWGELDETKKLAREAVEEWQHGKFDRIDQLLLQMTLNRRPAWAPLVELLAQETEVLAYGLQYRPAFIQWARKQGVQVS